MTQALRQHWVAASSLLVALMLTAMVYIWNQSAINAFQETSRKAGFVLETLTLEGLQRTKRSDVLALLDMDAGMPLMAVNLADVQKSIEALPWVRRASVTRVLPGDINIVVEERAPFALWQLDGKLSLIDNEGIVIKKSGLAAFADLPIVVGNFAQKEMQSLFNLIETTPVITDQIRSLVRVGDRRWDVLFESGIRLKLPADQAEAYSSEAAWKKFVELEQKHRLLAREVSVIDMRVRDRLIMRVTPAGRRMMDGKEWAT